MGALQHFTNFRRSLAAHLLFMLLKLFIFSAVAKSSRLLGAPIFFLNPQKPITVAMVPT